MPININWYSRMTMTNDERYALLKVLLCHLDNEDDETIRIFHGEDQHSETDYAFSDFYHVYLKLWQLTPPRRVSIDCNGNIKSVTLFTPEWVNLSEKNWNIPAIDQALFQLALDKADRLMKTVTMFGGNEPTNKLEQLEKRFDNYKLKTNNKLRELEMKFANYDRKKND